MSFLDGLFKNGTLAADLATNDSQTIVNVDAAAPPAAGEVLTAIDGTHAVWSPPGGGGPVPTRDLLYGEGGGTPGSINVGNSPTPAVGYVLTALNAEQAGWYAPIAYLLRTATGAVQVSQAAAPAAGQVLTADSASAASWKTPAAGGGASGPEVQVAAQTAYLIVNRGAEADIPGLLFAIRSTGQYMLEARFRFAYDPGSGGVDAKLAAYPRAVSGSMSDNNTGEFDFWDWDAGNGGNMVHRHIYCQVGQRYASLVKSYSAYMSVNLRTWLGVTALVSGEAQLAVGVRIVDGATNARMEFLQGHARLTKISSSPTHGSSAFTRGPITHEDVL